MTTTQMKAAMSNAKPFVPNKMDFPSLGDDDSNSTECNSPLVSCSSGSPKTESICTSPENSTLIKLSTEEVFHVKVGHWHQIINSFDDPCHIIEIQYGEETNEDDIERLAFYEHN